MGLGIFLAQAVGVSLRTFIWWSFVCLYQRHRNRRNRKGDIKDTCYKRKLHMQRSLSCPLWFCFALFFPRFTNKFLYIFLYSLTDKREVLVYCYILNHLLILIQPSGPVFSPFALLDFHFLRLKISVQTRKVIP